LLKSWRHSVSFFFGLVSLEIWGRLVFREETVEALEHQIGVLEDRLAA
jgi:hypothetical protein